MTELNISKNLMTYDGRNFGHMSGVSAISDGIPTMGALKRIRFGDDAVVTMKTDMKENDFSDEKLALHEKQNKTTLTQRES